MGNFSHTELRTGPTQYFQTCWLNSSFSLKSTRTPGNMETWPDSFKLWFRGNDHSSSPQKCTGVVPHYPHPHPCRVRQPEKNGNFPTIILIRRYHICNKYIMQNVHDCLKLHSTPGPMLAGQTHDHPLLPPRAIQPFGLPHRHDECFLYCNKFVKKWVYSIICIFAKIKFTTLRNFAYVVRQVLISQF